MSLSQRLFSEAFRDIQRTMSAFDQSLYNTARRSMLGSSSALTNSNVLTGHLFRFPPTDMLETSDSYELHAELPGYDKKNIKIELANDRTLVLSGSNKENSSIQNDTAGSAKMNAIGETADSAKAETVTDSAVITTETQKTIENTDKEQYWVKERVSGSFSRSFTFNTPINPSHIKASFDNGILKVTVPKNVEAQSRKISIE